MSLCAARSAMALYHPTLLRRIAHARKTSLTAFIVAALVWVASGVAFAGIHTRIGGAGIMGGCLYLCDGGFAGIGVIAVFAEPWDRGVEWSVYYSWSPAGDMVLFLPLWPAVALSGIWTAVAWTRRPLPKPGACPKCGYDLGGLGEGAPCPECGGATA